MDKFLEDLVQILPFDDSCIEFAQKIQHKLSQQDIFSDVVYGQKDVKDQTIGKKIRNAWIFYKAKNILIIGPKELENGSVSWKKNGGEVKEVPLEKFLALI